MTHVSEWSRSSDLTSDIMSMLLLLLLYLNWEFYYDKDALAPQCRDKRKHPIHQSCRCQQKTLTTTWNQRCLLWTMAFETSSYAWSLPCTDLRSIPIQAVERRIPFTSPTAQRKPPTKAAACNIPAAEEHLRYR
jgi:hypothetical protein